MNELEKAIYLELFTSNPSKSERTKLTVIEAAISCYSKRGLQGPNYDEIARAAKVSRPLVRRYFPTLEDLFVLMIKYIRARFQYLTIETIRKETTPQKRLEGFVKAAFDWVRDYPSHATVWLLFYHYSSIKESYYEMNTDFTSTGFERVKALLIEGKQKKVFHCKDVVLSAKFIQATVTGVLVSLHCEQGPFSPKEFYDNTIRICLELANRR